MADLVLDHLVFTTVDLDLGAKTLGNWLGHPLEAGGQHVGFGTHNRLLNLSQGVYLELIAIDPSQGTPEKCRPFELDTWSANARPGNVQLRHVVARTTLSISQLAVSYPKLIGTQTLMQRGELRWIITLNAQGHLPGDGGFPTVIDWGTTAHPSGRLLPSPISFDRLAWESPHAKALERAFEVSSSGSALLMPRYAEKARLHLKLTGPKGALELTSDDLL
jgi:Glyoxalase-like domain